MRLLKLSGNGSAILHPGSISLALQVDADLVLMDERASVQKARRLGLTFTGTIGVLDRAAERKLVDLTAAIAKLQLTNFRISPVLLDRLLKDDAARAK